MAIPVVHGAVMPCTTGHGRFCCSKCYLTWWNSNWLRSWRLIAESAETLSSREKSNAE